MLLICGSSDKNRRTGWTQKKPLLIFFPSSPRMLPLSSVFKNSLAISVSPLLRSWHFLLPPLGVLRDFSCSVKSAAALMARLSRAVIQTYKQLEYKFCPEFALAGSSSRGHKDLFIYFKPLRTWQPAVIWWLGDGKIHLICVLPSHACRGFISKWEGGEGCMQGRVGHGLLKFTNGTEWLRNHC